MIAPRQFHRQQHVLFGGEGRDQVIGLEHEADFAPAQQRHLVLARGGDVLAVEDHLPAGGRVEPREQAEQRAFSAARRPHDGGKLALRDFEVDTFQDVDAVRAGVDGFGKGADLNQPLLWHQMTKLWLLQRRCCSLCG